MNRQPSASARQPRGVRPEAIAYEGEFQQLQKFRGLATDALRIESLLLAQIAIIKKLDQTNGSVWRTRAELDKHLNEHREEIAGLDYAKLWGRRGVAALAVLVGAVSAVYWIVVIIEHTR